MEAITRRCRRCGSPQLYIVLDKVHLESRKCLLESCNKKIRSTLGRSKLFRNNDPILISYSGGPSSTALLDLIKNSIDSDTRREQKFRPSILHIDTKSLLNPTASLNELRSDRQQKLEKLLFDLSEAYPGWPIYWTSIEMCMIHESERTIFAEYTGPSDISDHLLTHDDAHIALHRAMDGANDLTERQQIVADKSMDLIVRVAHEVNSLTDNPDEKLRFVFTGSTATQLANNLLVDVILGRGSAIRSTVSVCDQRHPVPIVRPMREFSKKEVAFYLRARNLEPLIQPNLLTMASRCSSIQTATESFLTKLYVDYPATYSTLLKTGNKMQD